MDDNTDEFNPDKPADYGPPVPAEHEAKSLLELNDDVDDTPFLPHDTSDSQILPPKKEEDGEAQPAEEPDPWSRIDPVQQRAKKESSPSDNLPASTDSLPASPSHSSQCARSDSPLSSLASDDELDEKPPISKEPAPKRVRPRREVYIPMWQLSPLVCNPTDISNVEDDVHVTVSGTTDGDYRFMDDLAPEPQTPPRSPTPVRITSGDKTTRFKAHAPRVRAGTSTQGPASVKVEEHNDDDVIDALAPDTQYLRASEIDVKVKVEELDEATLNDRLTLAGARQFVIKGDLDEKGLDSTVHRKYLSNVFGGRFIGTAPNIAFDKWKVHGFNDIMYALLSVHPSAPRTAGKPGLWFSSGKWPHDQAEGESGHLHRIQPKGKPMSEAEIKAKAYAEGKVPPNSSGEWRTFIGFGHSRWLYAGQYSLIRMDDLSQKEWLDQKNSFRLAWGKYFAKYDWGKAIRCRVKLRRDNGGNEPTLAALRAALDSGDDFKSVVDHHDIVHAFNTGKERLGVWVMNCVGYDMDFQKRIVPESAAWLVKRNHDKTEKAGAIAAGEIEDPKKQKKRVAEERKSGPSNAKAAPKKAGSKQKLPARKASGKGKRKRSDDEDDDGFEGLVYDPRPTKKRAQPIDISDIL